MSVLLKEIRRFNDKAASELEKADIHTDSELQLLSRQDLSELFPGAKNFKLRKTIFEMIHKRKPIDVLLKELQGFIPHDSLRAGLSNNGILVDYLHILKDMKTQVDNVQSFLEAHIGLLENFSKAQPSPEACKDAKAAESITDQIYERLIQLYRKVVRRETGHTQLEHRSSSLPQPSSGKRRSKVKTGGPVNHHHGQTEATQHQTQEDSPSMIWDCGIDNTAPSGHHAYGGPRKAQASVKYKMVVTAKTFGAHFQLLNEIRGSGQEFNLVQVEESESSNDVQVIIVFCPVVSRPGTDVEAAMKTVRDDKPVILVLMHHSHEARPSVCMKSWCDFPNVVLHVNVFYHEIMKGLIQCSQNQDAVSKMRQELLRYSSQGTRDAIEYSSNIPAYSGSMLSGAGGYNDTRSRNDNQAVGLLSLLKRF